MLTLTCLECQTMFEAQVGHSARCPSCGHRYPKVTGSVDRPGTAAQSSAYWAGLVARGQALDTKADEGKWALGDLAAEVNHVFGPAEFRGFAAAIGEPESDLRNYLAVQRSYPKPEDRTAPLSWAHHAKVRSRKDRQAMLTHAKIMNFAPDQMKPPKHAGSSIGGKDVLLQLLSCCAFVFLLAVGLFSSLVAGVLFRRRQRT